MTKKMKKVAASIKKNEELLKSGQEIAPTSNSTVVQRDPKKDAYVKAAMKQAIQEKQAVEKAKEATKNQLEKEKQEATEKVKEIME